jgi:flagellar basal-body rod protein FlgF
MSDQVLYILMTGANAVMDRMTATTNNLANVNTTGFKAQQPVFQSFPLYNQGQPDRVDVAAREATANFASGATQQTGRSLDIAVKGPGWIAVQGQDGNPAYTRAGSLHISALGVLETAEGHPVLGQSGTPITLPPLQSVSIGDDGTVSGVQVGQEPTQIAAFDRIMLANPPSSNLARQADGLFADQTGALSIDGQVQVQSGALEQSNVDPVGMMVTLIENSRMFQMQTNLMHTVATMGQGGQSPLSLTS